MTTKTTIAELLGRLNQNGIQVTGYRKNKVPLLRQEIIDYIDSFPQGSAVTPTFFINLLETFFPKDDFWNSDINEDFITDFWRIGYYSGIWRLDYNTAAIVSFLGANAFVDPSADPFIAMINRYISFFHEEKKGNSNN